jgi:hypothetical protein
VIELPRLSEDVRPPLVEWLVPDEELPPAPRAPTLTPEPLEVPSEFERLSPVLEPRLTDCDSESDEDPP